MAQTSYTLELRAGPHGKSDLSVVRFLGSEAISEPFALEVDFFPVAGGSSDLDGLCTTEARLTVRRSDGEERYFHGMVSSARLLGTPGGSPRYRLVISPKAALLGCGKKSRTFLDRTVPQVVKQLFDGGRIAQRWTLRGAPPYYAPAHCYRKRECTVQYLETDLACAMRLLEREGIFFYFAQSSSGHELVVGDGAQAFEQVEEPLPFRTKETASWRTDYLYQLSRQTHRVAKRVVLRDYDFEQPQVDLTCAAGAATGELSEVYEHPGGYVDLEDGKRLAQIRLEELQLGAETWKGRAESMRLAAGRVFEVAEHPDYEWNQKLLAVQVTHQGSQQRSASGAVEGIYQCGFQAIAADRPYRPRRRTPKPRIAGYQRATVVGPEKEEIETDRYGRVKLAYHWNGCQGEEPRSGWVRVKQALAGPGYGALFIPRVGQEVLVSFQGGDPERPVVLNAAYHGDHRAPVKLPHDKTRTALRTDSSPSSSGYGYNELYFEDTAGQEEIHLRAQRDELIEVLNDKTQQVSGSEKLTVQKDRSQKVGGNQSLKVGGDDQAEVRGSQTLAVAKDRTVTVGADHSETVGALKTVTVSQDQTVRVAQAAAVTVGGGADLNVGGGYSVNAGVDLNIAVGGARLEEVGGLKAEVVGAAPGGTGGWRQEPDREGRGEGAGERKCHPEHRWRPGGDRRVDPDHRGRGGPAACQGGEAQGHRAAHHQGGGRGSAGDVQVGGDPDLREDGLDRRERHQAAGRADPEDWAGDGEAGEGGSKAAGGAEIGAGQGGAHAGGPGRRAHREPAIPGGDGGREPAQRGDRRARPRGDARAQGGKVPGDLRGRATHQLDAEAQGKGAGSAPGGAGEGLFAHHREEPSAGAAGEAERDDHGLRLQAAEPGELSQVRAGERGRGVSSRAHRPRSGPSGAVLRAPIRPIEARQALQTDPLEKRRCF